MKEIKLTQGKVAIVDDIDYNWLSQWKWHVVEKNRNFYAVRKSSNKNGKRHTIYMAREILGLELGDRKQGDHRNHNTLNNCRDNLRICPYPQNQYNQNLRRGCSSTFKGVHWDKFTKRWMVQIMASGRRINLGRFNNEIEAANIYDIAAKKYFGEFANTNFKREYA